MILLIDSIYLTGEKRGVSQIIILPKTVSDFGFYCFLNIKRGQNQRHRTVFFFEESD